MANVQIPQLPLAIGINGTEQLEAVQEGSSVRITTSQIADYVVNATSIHPIYESITPTRNFQNYRILTSAADRVVEAGTAIADYLTLGTQHTLQGSLTLANTAAGNYPVTLKSSNSSTSSAIYTLPPAPAAGNGYLLTSTTSGVMSWTNPTGLAIDIDVNSTVITGGTSGRLVYDNSGTFGEISAITTDGSAYGETWADGDVIWYNPVTGNPTKTKPVAPNIKVQLGVVTNAGAGGSGSFFVRINLGSTLGGTDSNVQLTAVASQNLLQYDSTAGYWKNVFGPKIGRAHV